MTSDDGFTFLLCVAAAIVILQGATWCWGWFAKERPTASRAQLISVVLSAAALVFAGGTFFLNLIGWQTHRDEYLADLWGRVDQPDARYSGSATSVQPLQGHGGTIPNAPTGKGAALGSGNPGQIGIAQPAATGRGVPQVRALGGGSVQPLAISPGRSNAANEGAGR